MKDLLMGKPTLAELTSISESHLECFATRLCSCLVGPNVNNIQPSTTLSAPWTGTRSEAIEGGENTQSSSTPLKPLRTRQSNSRAMKWHTPYQGSLSTRPSSFKEGFPRSLASLRSTSRDKIGRRGDLCLRVVGSALMTKAVRNHSVEASLPKSESLVDKGARDTLRLLIGGSSGQSSTSLMGVFPAFLNDEDKQGVTVAGGRGLVGLASVSERSARGVSLKKW